MGRWDAVVIALVFIYIYCGRMGVFLSRIGRFRQPIGVQHNLFSISLIGQAHFDTFEGRNLADAHQSKGNIDVLTFVQ